MPSRARAFTNRRDGLPPRAISFGEIVIDDFPDGRVVAGSPLNVAVNLASRGWMVHMISRIGRDRDGKAALEMLDRWSVERSLVQEHPKLPTGRVTVDITSTGHTFTIHRPAAWDEIMEPVEIPEHDVFCYATLAGRSVASLSTLKALLKRAGRFRALDVNLRAPEIVDDALAEGVRAATLIKVNDDEFGRVADTLGFARSPAAYFHAVPGLRWLAVTFGTEGAELYARNGAHWKVPGRKVRVVDSVGAGDAFFAGLIDSLTRGRGGRAALDGAQEAAVEIVQRRGGLPVHSSRAGSLQREDC